MKKILFLLSFCTLVTLLIPLKADEKIPPKLEKYLLLLEKVPHNDYLFEKAWALYQKSSLPSLAPRYEKKVQEDSQNHFLLILLSRIYLRENRCDRALEALKKAQALSPQDAVILRYQARIYLDQGETQKALEAFEQIPRKSPDLREEMGILYHRKGDLLKASFHWEKILSNPPKAKEINRIARLYLRYNMYEKAEVFLEKNLPHVRNPLLRLRLQHSLGETQRRLGKFDKALFQFEEILQQTQKGHWLREMALSEKRKIYLHQGRGEELGQYYLKKVEKTKDLEDYRELVRTYQEISHPHLRKTLERAQGLYPDFPYFFNELIKIYREEKKYDQALLLYQKKVEKYPGQVKLWIQKGDLHYKKGESKKALFCWGKISHLSPTPEGYLKEGHLLFGYKEKKEALFTLERGLAKFPKDPEFRVRAAALARDRGEASWARKSLEVLKTQREIPPQDLSKLLSRNGFYSDSLAVLGKVGKATPPLLWEKAQNYLYLKKNEKALDLILQAYALSQKDFYLKKILEVAQSKEMAELALEKLNEKTYPQAAYYRALGRLYERIAQDHKALECYKKGYSLFPGDLEIQRRMAEYYFFEDPNRALGFYQKLSGSDPTRQGHYLWQMAQIYRNQKKEDQFKKLYDRLRSLPRLEKKVYLDLAQYYQRLEPKKSLDLLERANIQYPGDFEILMQIYSLIKDKNPQKARQVLWAYYDKSQDKEKKSKIEKLLAWVHILLGKEHLKNPGTSSQKKARDCFNQALLYSHGKGVTLIEYYLLKSYLLEASRTPAQRATLVSLCQKLQKKQEDLIPLEEGLFTRIAVLLEGLFPLLHPEEREKLSLPKKGIAPLVSRAPKHLFTLSKKEGEILGKYRTSYSYCRLDKPCLIGDKIWFFDQTNRLNSLSLKNQKVEKFPLQSWYSPLFTKDKMFLGSTTLSAYNLPSSGSSAPHPLWQIKYLLFPQSPPYMRGYPFYPLKLIGNKLLVFYYHDLYCLDQATGKILWIRLYSSQSSPYGPVPLSGRLHINQKPSLLQRGREILALYPNRLESLSIGTGERVWKRDFSDLERTQYNLGLQASGKYVFVAHREVITRWDSQTGKPEGTLIPKIGATPYLSQSPLMALEADGNYLTTLYRVYKNRRMEMELHCYDAKKLKLLWKEERAFLQPYGVRGSLKIQGSHLILSHEYLVLYDLKTGKVVWEDLARKMVLQKKMAHTLGYLSRPAIYKDQLVLLDSYGFLYLYRPGKFQVSPPQISPSPEWKSLRFAREVTFLGFSSKKQIFSLRFKDTDQSERDKLLQTLKKSPLVGRVLEDFQRFSEKNRVPLKSIVFSLSSGQKTETVTLYQPYFFKERGMFNIPYWKLKMGVVIYLSDESRKKLLAGKIAESGIVKALGEAFLQNLYGFVNFSHLSPEKWITLFVNEKKSSYGFFSSPFYAFSQAFGTYTEISYTYSHSFKRSLSRILESRQSYLYRSQDLRNYSLMQSLFLLSLEDRTSREKILTVLFQERPQDFNSFLKAYIKEYPGDERALMESLKTLFGRNMEFTANVKLKDLLRDVERNLEKFLYLIEKKLRDLFR